jgi:hypothetical protein
LSAKNAIVTNSVIDSPAPRTYAAELRRQFSLVARKTELTICAPAIITNESGRRVRKLIFNRSFGRRRSPATSHAVSRGGVLLSMQSGTLAPNLGT